MSKVWGSISFLIIFILGIIVFVVIDVFSSQPEKLSSNFISFTLNSQTLYSGTNEEQEPYLYTLKIETSYNENFQNAVLSYSHNVRANPLNVGTLSATYSFYVISGTEIEFVFCTSNYETKSQSFPCLYKVNGETQIFAESVENLPDPIEIDLQNTSTYEILYSVLPSNANCYELKFLKSDSESFSLTNNTITAISVGTGTIFVWLDNTLIKTIPVKIIETEETQEESEYSFDISIYNEEDWISYNSATKTAVFNTALFPYNECPTVSFEIYIKNKESQTVQENWSWIINDEDGICISDNIQFNIYLALTFSGVGCVELYISNTELGISEPITINIIP